MIERQDGTIQFVCDACPEHLETGDTDFAAANVTRRGEGWTTEKVGPEWLHLCPGCRERPRR